MKKTFLTVLRSNDMKYFVISDIHNCCTAFKAALDEKGFYIKDPEQTVISLGDAFEKGDEPQETYLYLKQLLDCGKLIWIRGNHDIELVNAIKSKKLNKTNRHTATALAQVFNPAITDGTPDETICETLTDSAFDKWILENSRDFYETQNHVFVHGFIPLDKGGYIDDWRDLPSSQWSGARKKCAVREIMKNGVRIPEKTVVCGHVGAYYGHIKENYPNIEFDSTEFKKIAAKVTRTKPREYYIPYYGEGVISIDANAYDTGFMNCIVIEK